MATLYKQKGSENWYIQIYRTGQSRPDRIATRTPNRKEAERMLNAMVGDQAKGVPIYPKAHTVEFWQLAELVLNDYENEGYSSLVTAKNRFDNHVTPFFGRMLAQHITESEIIQYKDLRKKEGAAKATVRHELELVKRAFTLGQRTYKIVGPHIALPKIGDENARQGFFEQADFEKVYRAMPEYYRPFLLFAYITGWRAGEIKNLRRRHLNFVTKEIRLDPPMTKTRKARVFPMICGLEAMLRAVTARPGFSDDYVFTYQRFKKDGTPIGKPRPIGDYQRAFNTACYQAGLPCETEPYTIYRKHKPIEGVRVVSAPYLPVHDFRRTAVRNLTNMAIQETVAMALTGHRTRRVFDAYRIVSPDDLRMAGSQMEIAYASLQSNLATDIVPDIVLPVVKKRSFIKK